MREFTVGVEAMGEEGFERRSALRLVCLWGWLGPGSGGSGWLARGEAGPFLGRRVALEFAGVLPLLLLPLLVLLVLLTWEERYACESSSSRCRACALRRERSSSSSWSCMARAKSASSCSVLRGEGRLYSSWDRTVLIGLRGVWLLRRLSIGPTPDVLCC